MNFLWPQMLWALVAAPLLVAGYVLWLRRRKKYAVRFSSLDRGRAFAIASNVCFAFWISFFLK